MLHKEVGIHTRIVTYYISRRDSQMNDGPDSPTTVSRPHVNIVRVGVRENLEPCITRGLFTGNVLTVTSDVVQIIISKPRNSSSINPS